MGVSTDKTYDGMTGDMIGGTASLQGVTPATT
jgi:hypothetical protein